jgi:hypothetical protein
MKTRLLDTTDCLFLFDAETCEDALLLRLIIEKELRSIPIPAIVTIDADGEYFAEIEAKNQDGRICEGTIPVWVARLRDDRWDGEDDLLVITRDGSGYVTLADFAAKHCDLTAAT